MNLFEKGNELKEKKRYSVITTAKFSHEIHVDAFDEADAKFWATNYRIDLSSQGWGKVPQFAYFDEQVGHSDNIGWEVYDSLDYACRAVELAEKDAVEEAEQVNPDRIANSTTSPDSINSKRDSNDN